ncbi:MAG: hypothetical protein ABI779_08990 [Acidobacteriota bacterium]
MIRSEEQHVIDVLARAGVTAEKIRESTHRTPDLHGSDGTLHYLIEVKLRTDDETLTKEVQERGYAYRKTPVAWTNTTATIFQDAIQQLDAADDPDAIKLVWVCARSRRGSEWTVAAQVRHTLYGISRVSGSGRGSNAPECLFFNESIFFRYKQLTGVVLDIGTGHALWLNPFNTRSNTLKTSALGMFLQTSVFDPIEAERNGSFLLADCDIDRHESKRVLEYVSSKYGIEHARRFNVDEHSTCAVVREDVIAELEAEEQALRDAEKEGHRG